MTLETWLSDPRAADAVGVYAYGHRPKPPQDPGRVPDRRLLGVAALALICGTLVFLLCRNSEYFGFWTAPYRWVTPDHWFVRANPGDTLQAFHVTSDMYAVLCTALLFAVCVRAGHWPEVLRRHVLPRLRRLNDGPAPLVTDDVPGSTPAEWPELRGAGEIALADHLTAELRAGRMNDVDYVRIRSAWQSALRRPELRGSFQDTVLRHGAAAFPHPSGRRDLPRRTADHDLLTSQVRIGLATADDRNPYEHRGAGLGLDPGLFGTCLLAVGPPGSGKTRRLVRPVVESLCLQAVSGSAAVLVVTAAGADLGPADSFDVVISLGDPASRYDLDLYGGTDDPDEAAGVLAEALLGGGEDTRRGATALGQLLGPYRSAHGNFPPVPELRELLDGDPAAVGALRAVVTSPAQSRELDARTRQCGRPGDIAASLADRIGLLDRPAFAKSFDVTGRTRAFHPRVLEHPLRVRVDLPERGHAEASRILARLVLAQFTAAMTARTDRSLFACLVLDDAAATISSEAIRGLQALRSANAGAVLTLRTLDDIPETLRPALLGACGCRMAFSGITTWDGKRFAEAWGTTWVEARDVTRTPDQSGGLLKRLLRLVRRIFTGEAVTTESVTVRKVERERWSASELAHSVPAGHAVLSLTATNGDHAPPVLVDLRR